MCFSRIISLFALTTWVVASPANHDEQILLVAHQGRGVLSVGFNPAESPSNSLRLLDTASAGTRPNWICEHNEFVYSMARTFYPTNASDSGGVYSWLNERGEASLEPLSDVSSRGKGGVHCDVSSDGRRLVAANIDGSTVSVFPIAEDGAIGEATQTFHHEIAEPGPGAGTSQSQSYPHQAKFDPSSEYFFVPDKGGDVIYVYKGSSADDFSHVLNVTMPPGTAPRHLDFTVVGARKSMMYVVNELANTIMAYAITGVNNTPRRPAKCEGLTVTLVQTISTIGLGRDPTPPEERRTAAELAITNDRRFIYASNRFSSSPEDDTLAVFSLDESHPTTPLKYLGLSSTGGKVPRHFSISRDRNNKYIAVTNQMSNNLVVFERNIKSGAVGKIVGALSFGDLDTTGTQGPQNVIWR